MGFRTPLDVRMMPGSDRMRVRLLAPMQFRTRIGTMIEVPAGFVSDGASVPFPFNAAFPAFGSRWAAAAVLHDYLTRVDTDLDRAQADRVFLDASTVMGAAWYQRWPMYGAVRAYSRLRSLPLIGGAVRWLHPDRRAVMIPGSPWHS